jgi:hypothetical protein
MPRPSAIADARRLLCILFLEHRSLGAAGIIGAGWCRWHRWLLPGPLPRPLKVKLRQCLMVTSLVMRSWFPALAAGAILFMSGCGPQAADAVQIHPAPSRHLKAVVLRSVEGVGSYCGDRVAVVPLGASDGETQRDDAVVYSGRCARALPLVEWLSDEALRITVSLRSEPSLTDLKVRGRDNSGMVSISFVAHE